MFTEIENGNDFDLKWTYEDHPLQSQNKKNPWNYKQY